VYNAAFGNGPSGWLGQLAKSIVPVRFIHCRNIGQIITLRHGRNCNREERELPENQKTLPLMNTDQK
jgi:hypothetical protein